MHKIYEPVDPRGVEPPTSSLQMKRSTGELRARKGYNACVIRQLDGSKLEVYLICALSLKIIFSINYYINIAFEYNRKLCLSSLTLARFYQRVKYMSTETIGTYPLTTSSLYGIVRL